MQRDREREQVHKAGKNERKKEGESPGHINDTQEKILLERFSSAFFA